jgi:biotin carboxyl carrier protein
MSNPGKVIQITARPAEAADLAVEVDGIVEARTAQLGDSVAAFDFAGFYAILGQTAVGSSAQLEFDSQGIRSYGPVALSALLSLRVESLKAILDKAIIARENAFYTKYESAAALVAQTMSSYSPQAAGSKPQLLHTLSGLSHRRDGLLQDAYHRDGRMGVVESTTSRLAGHTASSGQSTAASSFIEGGTSVVTDKGEDDTAASSEAGLGVGTDLAHMSVKPYSPSVGLPAAVSLAETAINTESDGSSALSGSGKLSTGATEISNETQTITNTGYDYHVPSLEAEAQNLRAQISLIDEQYDQFVSGQKLPNLNQMLANELKMIDLDVRLLQIAYFNTMLLSPINGVVTGVFADAGDSVRAGQVLVRVENNMKVLLETTLVYRGSVSVGNTVTVQTNLFSKPANSVTISGTVVAARGDSDDDRWNIVVSCENQDNNGQEILPLHYSFDHDDTSITIS